MLLNCLLHCPTIVLTKPLIVPFPSYCGCQKSNCKMELLIDRGAHLASSLICYRRTTSLSTLRSASWGSPLWPSLVTHSMQTKCVIVNGGKLRRVLISICTVYTLHLKQSFFLLSNLYSLSQSWAGNFRNKLSRYNFFLQTDLYLSFPNFPGFSIFFKIVL